jgi:hypothetical protein
LSGDIDVDDRIVSIDVEYAHFEIKKPDGDRHQLLLAAEVCTVSNSPANVYRAAFDPGEIVSVEKI